MKNSSGKLEDYLYALPPELIAQYPAEKRDRSRLMLLDTGSGKVSHHRFDTLPSLLREGDAVVLNETKVVPSRLYGRLPAGSEIELLVTRVDTGGNVYGMVRGLKKLKKGMKAEFGNGLTATFEEREGESGKFRTSLEGDEFIAWMEKHGHTPLPPYITRADEPIDRERYQTVFARNPGSCAAPTAGLHFTDDILARLKNAGIDIMNITLHVGPGTFKPIQTEEISAHKLGSEYASVSREVMERCAEVRKAGGRVVAVGSTATRALESAAAAGGSYEGETSLYILPGYEFKAIDGMLTNFHLPGSTLLVLVAAFAGRERTLDAYRTAVEERYRFYSYGDALLLLRPSAG